MAETKSLEQLKAERTSAKRLFSRLANSVSRTHLDMCEEELKESFKNLSLQATKVMEANEDVEAALIAEAELDEEDEPALNPQQKADLEKTASECDQRLREGKALILKTLWASFGDPQTSLAFQVAETECDRVLSVQSCANLEAYDFMLNHLGELVKAAREAHVRWNRWAPSAEQKDLKSRLRELEVCLPKLVSRKAEFIQAKVEQDSERAGAAHSSPRPAIKLKPTSLPKFAGSKRDFHRWRKEWEALQKQGEPTGSKEVKKFQLLDSLDDKVAREFRLAAYNTAEEIFRVLENRFGNKATIALEIAEELQAMPPVRGHQARKIVELIQMIEKALYDLGELGDTGAMKNPLVTKSIESKLPESLKKEWLVYIADEKNAGVQQARFDKLLEFLKTQEAIYEQLEQLREDEPSRKESRSDPRHARTRATELSSDPAGCIVCGDSKHKKKLYFCKKFRTLKPSEKENVMRRLRACKRCLEIHEGAAYCKSTYLCRNLERKDQQTPEHHYYLCPYAETRRTPQKRTKTGSVGGGKCTESQEEFLSKLSPELAQQCRDAFCNSAFRTLNSGAREQGLLTESGLQEFPVIMMLQ